MLLMVTILVQQLQVVQRFVTPVHTPVPMMDVPTIRFHEQLAALHATAFLTFVQSRQQIAARRKKVSGTF